jgi:pantoate--beta-alanine ligase
MEIVSTFAEARERAAGHVGLVPTMGYLHEGHLSLATEARKRSDLVVMSLFVNPLQFGEASDLARYPRDLCRDAALAEAAGVDVLFAPALDEMYPTEPVVRVDVGSLADVMEGPHRPGHFAGVAIAVTKLFAGVRPDSAFFGRKDAQQLAIVRRLAADLSLPLDVVGCSTIRDAEGVALSSRNIFLDEEEHRAATAVGRGLMAAADAVEDRERSGGALEALVASAIASEPMLRLEYVALASAHDCSRLSRLDEEAFLATAVHVGATRLIDNVHIDLRDGAFVADRGVRLDGPTILEAN